MGALDLKRDEELVILCREDNMDAKKELFLRYKDRVRGWLYNKRAEYPNLKYEDFEDIFENIFYKVFSKGIENYDENMGPFYGYFWEIVRNVFTDYLRDKNFIIEGEKIEINYKEVKDVLADDKRVPIVSEIKYNILENIVIDAINSIKNIKYKKAILLDIITRYPSETLSKILHRNPSTVKSDIRRGYKEICDFILSLFNKEGKEIAEETIEYCRDSLYKMDLLLEKIPDENAREILRLAGKGIPINRIAESLNLKEEEVIKLINKAVENIIKGEVKKKEEIKKSVSTIEAIEILDSSLDMISKGIDPLSKKVRGTSSRISKIRNIQKFAKILFYTFHKKDEVKPVRTLIDLINKKVKEDKISYDELCKQLGVNIHELTSILVNKVSLDKTIKNKLLRVLKIKKDELENVISSMSFPEITSKTRKRIPDNFINEKVVKRTLKKILSL